MARTSLNRCIKNRDNYPNPILLTFKKNKYHQTVCGGILTITCLFLFILFFSFELYKIATFNYTVSNVEELLAEVPLPNPMFEMTMN